MNTEKENNMTSLGVLKHFFSKLIGKTYILQSGRPAWRLYRKSAVREDSAFFLFKLID